MSILRQRGLATEAQPAPAGPRADAIRCQPCADCLVRDMAVCAVLAPAELDKLAAILADTHADAGGAIFREGDEAQSVFNVTAGTIKLYKLLPDGRRQVTGFLFPGDFLGLAVNDRYGYTAEALEPARLCRFPRAPLDRLMHEFPKMKDRLFAMASNELQAAQDQMLLLGRKTAREKIASFLLQLQRGAERRGQPINPVHLPMGRSDIADFLGLTTETVSRTISALKRSGAIALREGGKVEIRDQEGLQIMAEGDGGSGV